MLANEMILFYHVVHLKSFSQAAEKLQLSKAYVSKHITLLEKTLKTRLLIRNTRRLTLTEAGELFYSQCEKIFNLSQDSFQHIANLRHQPMGTLKISIPPALALHLLDQPLLKFQKDYPEINLKIVLESRIIDLIQEGYDLAIRSAVLPNSNLIARKLASQHYYLCASPQYLKKFGPIEHPEQLSKHHFGIFSTGISSEFLEFTHEHRTFKVAVEGRFQCNQLDLILKLVLAGSCLAVLPEFMVSKAITQGEIIACLKKYRLPSKPLYIIYPQKEFLPLKVKVFIDCLKEFF